MAEGIYILIAVFMLNGSVDVRMHLQDDLATCNATRDYLMPLYAKDEKVKEAIVECVEVLYG